MQVRSIAGGLDYIQIALRRSLRFVDWSHFWFGWRYSVQPYPDRDGRKSYRGFVLEHVHDYAGYLLVDGDVHLQRLI